MTFRSDPALYLIVGGFLLTAGLTFRFGIRGLAGSAVALILATIVWWLYGVGEALMRDDGASESSRFAIWAGLLMGVPLILLFCAIGGSVGAVLGLTSRRLVQKQTIKNFSAPD
ncbi:hypothetical protein [Brevundimonas sp. SL130]|uniref:hypothetical protein n=1 Tax=Brevundimonas sp. SL130 TaxID=2995143 RepID=UPI00226C6D47|nr:hypothetical protein [Brevundimonas sp. SL130]WAC60006.1 hypothetical protein OU998_00745 [Brevundimonas sp. SL130]